MIAIASSGISYEMRDIYPISRYFWNVATCKWKVHNSGTTIFSLHAGIMSLNPSSLSCIGKKKNKSLKI
jgi:hypothetical protein